MKTIGLLGGMSWESTVTYYQLINKGVNETLGGLHSAKIVLYSVDFASIEELLHQGAWEQAATLLAESALSVQAAGADFLLICTNTMHKLAPQIESALDIPTLHIADATAEALLKNNITQVGLLGTSFTMEQEFYKGRLMDRHGINVVVPQSDDRKEIHRVIFEELCRGEVTPESRSSFLRIIDSLEDEGAEAVILGCTEIGMLLSQHDTHMPLYDTTLLHARKAVEYALAGKISL